MKIKDRQFSIPYPFKFIGLLIVVLTLVFTIAVKTLPIVFTPAEMEVVTNGIFSFLILGLFLIAFAVEKIEDERTILLKTKSLAGGFAGAIAYVIIKPFINLGFDFPMEVSGQEVALVMLLSHIIAYYLQKFTGKE